MPPVCSEKESARLWEEYRENPGAETRNEIVLAYAGLVKSIARRAASVSGNYVDAEDLLSYGMIGLIKAVEKYDPGKGVAFETFATYRIRGEVIDYMRRNDWIPRGVRKRSQEVERAAVEFAARHGREPTDEELAAFLGVSREELLQIQSEGGRQSMVSLEEMLLEASAEILGPDTGETPEGRLQESELTEMLARAIDALPERERLIISLYYYEELTLKEISSVLGVSESRVSQLHTRAVGDLRSALCAYWKA